MQVHPEPTVIAQKAMVISKTLEYEKDITPEDVIHRAGAQLGLGDSLEGLKLEYLESRANACLEKLTLHAFADAAAAQATGGADAKKVLAQKAGVLGAMQKVSQDKTPEEVIKQVVAQLDLADPLEKASLRYLMDRADACLEKLDLHTFTDKGAAKVAGEAGDKLVLAHKGNVLRAMLELSEDLTPDDVIKQAGEKLELEDPLGGPKMRYLMGRANACLQKLQLHAFAQAKAVGEGGAKLLLKKKTTVIETMLQLVCDTPEDVIKQAVAQLDLAEAVEGASFGLDYLMGMADACLDKLNLHVFTEAERGGAKPTGEDGDRKPMLAQKAVVLRAMLKLSKEDFPTPEDVVNQAGEQLELGVSLDEGPKMEYLNARADDCLKTLDLIVFTDEGAAVANGEDGAKKVLKQKGTVLTTMLKLSQEKTSEDLIKQAMAQLEIPDPLEGAKAAYLNAKADACLDKIGLGIFTAGSVPSIPAAERKALEDLYDKCGGRSWKKSDGWKTGAADWHGVTVFNGRVVKINLGSNELEGDLPDSIGNLRRLTYLDLDNNRLTGKVPESIADLVHLKEFYCSENQLSSLPESLGKLAKNLKELYCHENHLTKLPESIGKLANLQTFYCQKNRLTVLPESIGNLTKLKRFFCDHNKLEKPPQEVAEKGIDDIRQWFKERLL